MTYFYENGAKALSAEEWSEMRDKLAGQAMQGFIASNVQWNVNDCYQIADTMLKERER